MYLLLLYAIGYVAMFPSIFRWFLYDISLGGPPSTEDVVFAFMMAVIVASVWWLVVPVRLLWLYVLEPRISDYIEQRYNGGQ